MITRHRQPAFLLTPYDQKEFVTFPSLAANSLVRNGSNYFAVFGIFPDPQHILSTIVHRKPVQTGLPYGKLIGLENLLYLEGA